MQRVKMGKAGGKKASAMQVAQAAEAQAAAHRETPAQKRARIAELQERARLFGKLRISSDSGCLPRARPPCARCSSRMVLAFSVLIFHRLQRAGLFTKQR